MSATFTKYNKIKYRKIRNYRTANCFPCSNEILSIICQCYPLEEASKLTLDSIVTEIFYQEVTLRNFIIYHMRRGYNLNLKPQDVDEIWEVCYNVIQYYYHKTFEKQSKKAGHYAKLSKTYASLSRTYKFNLWKIQYKTSLVPSIVKQAYKPKTDEDLDDL